MQRATSIFSFEQQEPASPFVDAIWRTRSPADEVFISIAAAHAQIVVWTCAGLTHVTMRGPETKATAVPIPPDAEFIGIQLKVGTFIPDLPMASLVDGDLTLLPSAGRSVRLNGSVFEIPAFDDVDAFLRRLAGEGLLVSDPVVGAALQRRETDLCRRSVERRVRRATGLTFGTIRQIERARRATALLERGISTADAAICAGYSDQAHLTRSLRRFMGQTPGQIARDSR